MSIVAVHGPYTFGSRGVSESGPLIGTIDPTNGLKWDFNLDSSTTRSAQDFNWTFPPDGTPTPQNVANPTVVTYGAVGTAFNDPTRPTQPTKTATCVVTNVFKTVTNKALTNNVATLTATSHGFAPGQVVTVTGVDATFNGTYTLITASGNTMTYAKVATDVVSAASGGTVTSAASQNPAAGTYTLIVPVASGAAPGLYAGAPPEEGSEEPAPEETPPNGEDVFDPADYTIPQVLEYAEANPEQLDDIIAAEEAGKYRSTLLSQLEAMQDA